MFIFKREQKVFEVGGVRIGGQPGENPVVLVGGLFFRGQPIVEDHAKGLFNEGLLKDWLQRKVEAMDLTGLPGMLEIYAETPQAMVRYLSKISEEWSGAFTFESINPEARMAGVRYIGETGLQARAIFNSINASVSSEELEHVKEFKLKAAIALGWRASKLSLKERLDEVGSQIARCENVGIEKIIVDSMALPAGAGYGSGWRLSLAIKALTGLPVCVSPYNVVSAWKPYKELKFDEASRASMLAAAVASAILSCSDLVFYGSISRCREVYLAAALIEHGVIEAASEAWRAVGMGKELFSKLKV